AETVRLCVAERVPVIPFGAGTSLEGQVAALEGGVSIDLSQMDRVLRVSAEDLDCTVEAGVSRKALNQHLRDTGLFFPIDPGADATLGGMAATRASGTNAVRYGTMRENVLSLEVVLPSGEVIRTARRARKSAAGYDLTRLFVGSEGTLGVITQVTVRLHGVPEAVRAAVVSFPSLEAAVETVVMTIQAGIPMARIELLDEVQIDAVNRYSKLDYPVAPTLLCEFHGSAAGVKEQVEFVEALAREQGGTGFAWAETTEARNRLWQARHDAYFAALALRPGCGGWATDVCVPISGLVQCITETKREIEAAGLCAPIVGHVGDGNFHCCFILDSGNEAEFAAASRLNDRMVARAIALDGTCTGEHGVGQGKIHHLDAEHGAALGVMRTLKSALDPHNIMNPGKILRV
ncbi:MAG TPA: FAD-linked oxidase C-terminal domain-containing protein, partial [Stellaceae bacterium]|nr:FAD-linked oxidase C-terminal domain-containing protein [Stellaceae bacterium]